MKVSRWEAISTRQLALFAAGFGVYLFLVIRSEPGFVVPLDFANLLFHEAGHPIYGMLSERLAVYGGTLGQLTFPAILAVSFWRKRQAVSFAAVVVWFFENFLNVARYMADSRELVLPLVGGGDHDWNDIFFRWGVLSYDREIAAVTRVVGWIGMLAAVGFVGWRAYRDLRRRSGIDDARVGFGEPVSFRLTSPRDAIPCGLAVGRGMDEPRQAHQGSSRKLDHHER